MMQRIDNSHKLPVYYAWLIVFSLVPQLLSGNQILNMGVKITILLIFTSLIMSDSIIRFFSKDVLYLLIFATNALVPFFVDGGSLVENVQYVIVGIITFLVFFVGPRNTTGASNDSINKFFEIFAYFILISCMYNILVNFNSLLHITSLSVYSKNEIRSFFDNKNTFGFYLMYGVFSSAILKVRTGKSKWLFFIGIMLLNELMTMSRSSIVVSVIVVLLIIVSENRMKFRQIFIVLLLLLGFYVSTNISSGLNTLLFDNIFGNTDSLERRVDFINIIYPSIEGFHRVLGYGISRARDVSLYYTGIQYFHNTFLRYFVEGGYVKVVILIFWLLLSLKSGASIRHYNKQDGNICIISVAMYIIYCFAEAIPLFESPSVSITATIFVVAIPIYMGNMYSSLHYRNEE